MTWWLWMSGAVAGECDPDASTLRGLQSWLAGDRELTHAALDETAAAFACSGVAEPQTLARYWLLDGAVLAAAGDRDEAIGSFAAARRVAGDLWLQDLGPELHRLWLAAERPEGTGTVAVQPDPGPGRVWIDGAVSTSPEVTAGLHLVQVAAPDAADAAFATVVWVDPGVSVLVEAVVVAPVLEPTGSPAVVEVLPPPEPSLRLELQVATGASSAFGDPSSDGRHREPQLKVAVPFELGVGVVGALGFARVQVGGAMLVGGRYLAVSPDGDPISRSTRLDLGVAAGLGDEVRFGVAGGMQWPSRLAGRVLVGWAPIQPLVAELRVGANVTTDREAEPAIELLVGVRR